MLICLRVVVKKTGIENIIFWKPDLKKARKEQSKIDANALRMALL